MATIQDYIKQQRTAGVPDAQIVATLKSKGLLPAPGAGPSAAVAPTQQNPVRSALKGALDPAIAAIPDRTLRNQLITNEYSRLRASDQTAAASAQKREEKKGLLAPTEEIVSQIENAVNKVNTVPQGWKSRAIGSWRQAKAAAGEDRDARDYLALTEGLVSVLARSLAGEKGTVTDRDVERVKKYFPQITDSREEAMDRINSVKKLVAAAQKAATLQEPSVQVNNQ